MAKEIKQFNNCNQIPLPKGYDPYDMRLKRLLNAKADEKNFISKKKDKYVLACGALRHKGRGVCSQTAGLRTTHLGHGRCYLHGGASTGPKTEQGLRNSAGNNRTHGLYAKALNKKEQEYYDQFAQGKALGLEHEIYFLKAKILVYLENWNIKYQEILEKEGALAAENKTRVFMKEGTGKDVSFSYYHAGTIEDKPLIRALETLARLVSKQALLNPQAGDNVLDAINKELRAASQGKVSLSWNTEKAQARVTKNE